MAVAGGIESIRMVDMLYAVMINIRLRQKLWLDFLISTELETGSAARLKN